MWDWIGKANELRKKGSSFVLATVIEITGSSPGKKDAKIIVLSDGSFSGTIGGGHLEWQVLKDASKIFESHESRIIKYPLTEDHGHLCGGEANVLFELIGDNPDLYLFGAGHVGQALCKTIADTPFNIHLIDDREEWVFSKELPGQVIKHLINDEDFIKKARWSTEKTYVAIMTPGHSKDAKILEMVLNKPFKYLGLMGSKHKWKEIKTALLDNGFSEKILSFVTCPIGLPIGGNTPGEIAVSIAAQLVETYNAK